MSESDDKRLLEALKGDRFGKSTSELAEIAKLDRRTVTKLLDVMKVQGLVEEKRAGMAKLWHQTTTPLLSVLSRDDESASLLKNVLDSLDEGITILDREMRVLFANKMVRDWSETEKISTGMTCHKLITGKDHICTFCPASQSFESGKVSKSRHVMKGKVVEYITSPIADKNNQIVGVIEIIREIGTVRELKRLLDE